MLSITTPENGEIQLTQSDVGDVVVRGYTVISGQGNCQNTVDFLRLEHLHLNASLLFASEWMQVDHPVVIEGRISGYGGLIVSGTLPFFLNDGTLDVGELRLCDGDASFPVPTTGYQSLTLEAKNTHSIFTLHGEYHVADFTLIADARALCVEVDATTVIHCSGSFVAQNCGDGIFRWFGDGSETWILKGNSSQTLDLEFEHGHHVLGTIINSKTGGDITVLSPIYVVDYRKPDGTPLPAPTNMIILSNQFLKGRLFLITSDSDSCIFQDGMKLENGKIMSKGTAAFFAQLTDFENQPLRPELVEHILLNCSVMNPIAPYLHESRRTVIQQLSLDIASVLSPVWRTDENRLPESQVFNFYLNSAMLRELQFDEPGLYYVTFSVKLFGHKNGVPFRYEILCERPSI